MHLHLIAVSKNGGADAPPKMQGLALEFIVVGKQEAERSRIVV